MKRNVAQGIMLAVLLMIVIIAQNVISVATDQNVVATVDIDPDTLNLKGKNKWVTCHIELPEMLEVRQIYISTIRLNGTIQATGPFELGDYDNDAIPDLMVKFSKTEVTNCILACHEMAGTISVVLLTVTGEVGTLPYFLILTFEGADTIRVIGK